MYCIKLGRSQDEFWHSSLAQILQMIEMYADEMQVKAAAINNNEYNSKYFQPKEEVRVIQSMKEIEGW
ncbi:MAG: hypothetical protein K0R92_519 [Lachnospiraceae bacterium]|jgi:hypothetical protein|nr:hypothetical protein [Lachnospiraceae bacterium]